MIELIDYKSTISNPNNSPAAKSVAKSCLISSAYPHVAALETKGEKLDMSEKRLRHPRKELVPLQLHHDASNKECRW